MLPDATMIGTIIAFSLWVMVPAMVPNTFAAIVGGGAPMDGGRKWRGQRLLGAGKTWRGFIGGITAGTIFGSIQVYGAHRVVPWPEVAVQWGFGPEPKAYLIVFTLALGSLLGDAAGSFYKRRMNMARGQKAPLLDQWNFLLGAWFLAAVIHFDWFMATFVNGWMWIGPLCVLVLVLVFHRLANILGYFMGQKQVPW